MLNGIIVINKPAGMTSADVVYQLRKILHIKKIGHAGTLDPDVSGVLPIAVGQATKLIDKLHEHEKQYQGTGEFGIKTDTGDLSGKVIAKKELPSAIPNLLIQNSMETLTGEVMQVPPMYSAVKINGKKLYEYARAGETVDVPARQIHVSEYKLTAASIFDLANKVQYFDFQITCSKGTYVRTLVEQLGDEIGVPAVMAELVRTKSSGYDLADAVTIEDVANNLANPEKFLQPIESVFQNMVKYNLSDSEYAKVQNGSKMEFPETTAIQIALVYHEKIIAIYQRDDLTQYRASLMLLNNI